MRTRVLIAAAVLAALFVTPAATAMPTATVTPPDTRPVQVLGLRYATHPDFDRVVIDLRGPGPTVRDGRARRFHYEGSGRPVPIRGRAGVWISLTASGHDTAGHNLYTGPRVARPRFDTLTALAITGDFEGQVTFAFALRYRADYTVRHLTGPSRLVIDFQHR